MKAAVSTWHFWNTNGRNGAWALQGVDSRHEEQHVQIHLEMPFCEAPASTIRLLLSL